jgi:hypothetical protein
VDAREAQLWLDAQKLKEKEHRKTEKAIKDALPRIPMTDEQWQKVKALSKCSFGSWTYDRRFVHEMVALPDGALITQRQADFIEKLWHRYRRQHGYELAAPRWIWDYKADQMMSTGSLYIFSEIGRFDNEEYDFCEPVEEIEEGFFR